MDVLKTMPKEIWQWALICLWVVYAVIVFRIVRKIARRHELPAVDLRMLGWVALILSGIAGTTIPEPLNVAALIGLLATGFALLGCASEHTKKQKAAR